MSAKIHPAIGFIWFLVCCAVYGWLWMTIVRYFLYLLKCGHIVCLTDLVTQGRIDDAATIARRAVEMARATGNRGVELTAMLTEARAERARNDTARAEARYAEAADLARAGHSAGRTREVLREWAELRATLDDHRGAYELTREALAVK